MLPWFSLRRLSSLATSPSYDTQSKHSRFKFCWMRSVRRKNNFKMVFNETVSADVPQNENIIASHKIHKFKKSENRRFKLKAKVESLRNENSLQSSSLSDCCVCVLNGFCIVASVLSLRTWRTTDIGAKAAFLLTEQASRDVHLMLPTERPGSKMCSWLILTASYSFVDAHENKKVVAVQALLDIVFHTRTALSVLF